MSEERVKPHGPFMTEILRGDPIHVEGHELVPWVRVTSRVRRSASVSGDSVGGGGWGFVHMRPVAILDRNGTGEHCLQVREEEAASIIRLPLVFLVVPMFAVLLMYLSHRSDDRTA
jgi:hypothetical protein